MTELKPCPFCGGEVHEVSPEERGDRFWRIECASCGVRMGGTHRAMNRKAWNTRAEDAESEMAQRIQSLELECAKLSEGLRKAGNRGGLTAEQIMAIMGRHQPDYCSDTHVCFDWQAIADELNATLSVGECEFKPFKGPISDKDEIGDRQGVCSECSAYMHEQFNFCPNCGRKAVKR